MGDGGLGIYDYGARFYSPKLLHTQELTMDRSGCRGSLFSITFVVLTPIVVYYLKNIYTTTELLGHQFDTMETVFPVYAVVAIIITYLLNVKRKPPQK